MICTYRGGRIITHFWRASAVAIAAGSLLAANPEERKQIQPPTVYEYRDGKDPVVVDDSNLFGFELAERRRFAKADPTEDLFMLACSSSSILLADPPSVSNPRELLLLVLKGGAGRLQTMSEFGEKHSERNLTAEEVQTIRKFVKSNDVDKLPRLESVRKVGGREQVIVGGTVYVYLHLTALGASRVWINNPPTKGDKSYAQDDPLWRYSKVVEFFSGFAKAEENPK